MVIRYASPLNRLVDVLMRLPGVGAKTAQRLAFYLLKASREEAMTLAEAIVELKEKIRICERCGNIAEAEQCLICQDPTRDGSSLCVVEEANDLLAIERTGTFKGLYHVLQGSLSPIEGRGPDQITGKQLINRLRSGEVKEVILATNPNVEGEATALYLARLIAPLGVRVTRIAHGLPVGGDLEYADEVTLGRALEGRRELG
ncbi:MAG: Recombination protein recR [candidate division NC10 bacterium CSP1-5]|nr:MAG: Recombination protein recR [candidate division NC10 bacterium CSP1-5]